MIIHGYLDVDVGMMIISLIFCTRDIFFSVIYFVVNIVYCVVHCV